jgi:plastocyanin
VKEELVRSNKWVALVAVGAVGVFAFAGPAWAVDATKAGPKVTITGTSTADFAFSPATVTVKKGGKVSWSWSGSAPHNITFSKLGVASGDETTGSFKHKFKDKGTFKYTCTIHGFKGKVVVN